MGRAPAEFDQISIGTYHPKYALGAYYPMNEFKPHDALRDGSATLTVIETRPNPIPMLEAVGRGTLRLELPPDMPLDVQVTADGYGSPGFSPEFLKRLTDAGANIHSFDPRPTLFRIRTNILCRLHRKIVHLGVETGFCSAGDTREIPAAGQGGFALDALVLARARGG